MKIQPIFFNVKLVPARKMVGENEIRRLFIFLVVVLVVVGITLTDRLTRLPPVKKDVATPLRGCRNIQM